MIGIVPPGTSAKWAAGTWVINERKSYIICSPKLDYFLTSAWIEEKGTVGFFLIPKETEGLTIEENWNVIAMRGTGSHDLVLENVVVDESDLVERSRSVFGVAFRLKVLLSLRK